MKRILFAHLFIIFLVTSTSIAEFQVNTRTSNNQANPAIAQDADGNFVIIWSSYFTGDRSNEILCQRFDPNCIAIGDEFQINTTTSGNQTEPSVATDAAGNFVVVWHGPESESKKDENIFAQRFDPNGQTIGDELLVNSYTQGKQKYPKVAMNMDGAFIIVWESEKLNADKDISVASCQLFDVNGLFVGDEFDVNSPADCRYPDVAMDANGNFAIVWMEDKGSRMIMAQLYNADGTVKTEPFEVSTIKFSSLTRPSIAMNDSGFFAVTWDGHPDKASLDDIHARLFDPNGTPINEQLTINTNLEGPQQYPHVTINSEGQFLIVWNSQTGTQSSERDIFSRPYDSSGKPLSDELQLNTYTEGDQKYADVALSETGVCVTVWQSNEQDGSGFGVFGEIFSIADVTETESNDLMVP